MSTVRNHDWWDPATLRSLGTIDAERVSELSEGRLRHDVGVRLNRAVVEHDLTLIIGPVFPHEVVAFSGGNKPLFPGVAAQDIIDLSHWLGALITSVDLIGTVGTTPVRALIDEAADMVPSPWWRSAWVAPGSDALHSISYGPPRAAEVSAKAHIRYLDHPVARVVSLIPTKYQGMRTGGKGFYKVEPVVADGGQVIIYAPHIRELSVLHPEIATIGYQDRDCFVKQWDRFSHLRWGDLAHSTHLRGAGVFDPETGEANRVTVTLANRHPRGGRPRRQPRLPRCSDDRHRCVHCGPEHPGGARRR